MGARVAGQLHQSVASANLVMPPQAARAQRAGEDPADFAVASHADIEIGLHSLPLTTVAGTQRLTEAASTLLFRNFRAFDYVCPKRLMSRLGNSDCCSVCCFAPPA